LEQVSPRQVTFGTSTTLPVAGQGSATVSVPLPDADGNDPRYVSSHQGAQYILHASLWQGSSRSSDVQLPIRLLFGVYPTNPLPSSLTAGHTYSVPIGWEELPSYLSPDQTPLDRAELWDSAVAGDEHYRVVLELISGSSVVVSNSFLTTEGTSNHVFTVTVPSSSAGPYSWAAYLQTATNVLSDNVTESFEGYMRGARWQGPNLPFLTNVNFLAPWTSYVYPASTAPWFGTNMNLWLNEGVQLAGSDGSQSGFVVATNPPGLPYSGFGLLYMFTNTWALPGNLLQWTNYSLAFDYMDTFSNLASLDLQLKDANGNWIQHTQIYNQPAPTWLTTQASLDTFTAPPPGASGPFDPGHVKAIALNVEMLAPGGLYVGSFDNIRFVGPEVDLGGGQTTSVYNSANDSLGWLTISRIPNGGSISWIGGGTLQSATRVSGPWSNLTNATNPYTFNPGTSNWFFRLHR
jgi:hypothetical protein